MVAAQGRAKSFLSIHCERRSLDIGVKSKEASPDMVAVPMPTTVEARIIYSARPLGPMLAGLCLETSKFKVSHSIIFATADFLVYIVDQRF